MILVLSQSGEKGKNKLLADDCIKLFHHIGFNSAHYKNFDDENIQKYLKEATTILMIVPEWNLSIPYTLKKAIDESGWPSSLENKNIGIIGTSGGHGGNILGASHLSHILSYLKSDVHKQKVYIPYINNFDRLSKAANDVSELVVSLIDDLCSIDSNH